MTRRNETGAAVFQSRLHERKTECVTIEKYIHSLEHGATIKEIAIAIGIVDSTVSARLKELREAGIIEESPIRRPCMINGIVKKLWVVSRPRPARRADDPQEELFA